MALTDTPLRDLLTAFSSSAPTPGGGSASALASAVGASLLMMVAGLPKTRSGSDADRSALAAAGGALTSIRTSLTAAIDADAAAYDQVVAAYRLPKGSGEELRARKAAVQQAMRAATTVPLDVVRLSAAALTEAAPIAAHCYDAAASDVGVAIALLRAGAHGARLNVEINMSSVSDVAWAGDRVVELLRWSDGARGAADDADALLRR
jgi:formiminotetrahydrofolate cyclodeaminase